MRDVIQRVIASEAEARQIVATARIQAAEIVGGARQAGEELRARVASETGAAVVRIMAEAERNAEIERLEWMARATDEITAEVNLAPELRHRTVAAVVRYVCGQTPGGKERP